MRPNYAQDAPPTSITVGGAVYPVNVDFRVWIEIQQLLRKLTPDGIETLEEAETLAFGGVLVDESPDEIVRALSEFLEGYPCAPIRDTGGGSSHDPTFSFDYDLNSIILAIRNQSGIDLSYRRTEPFHWWEFLLEFKFLSGDHYILNLMEARGYHGKDKDMLRRKRACALPVELSAEEQAELDEFSRQFEGIGE